MDVAKIITGLLYEHDCVVIPGIGALVAGYRPAEINRARKAIYPPSKSLVFNRNLRHDDGLLTTGMAGELKTGYDQAKQFVEKLAGEITSALDAGGKYPLEGLGYFYTDNRQSILFHPELSENLMLDSYGLSFVTYRADIRPLRYGKKRVLPEGTAGDGGRRPLRKWAYVAAAGVLAAAFSTLVWPGSTGGGMMNSTSVTPMSGEATVNAPGGNEDPAGPERSGNAGYNAGGLKFYHVIVGSYADFANARQHLVRMREAGYAARILFTGDKGYRVSVFSSADMEESENQLRQVQSALDTKAWLYGD